MRIAYIMVLNFKRRQEMNMDERFNYYVERYATKHTEPEVKKCERCLSEMLELGCSPLVVWQYAERRLNN